MSKTFSVETQNSFWWSVGRIQTNYAYKVLFKLFSELNIDL